MYAGLKAKYGLTSHVLQDPISIAAAPAAAGPPIAAASSYEQLQTLGVPALVARVKLSQTANQGIEQDVPLLADGSLRRLRARYIDICGDEPLAGNDPIDGQLTALHFLVENMNIQNF